MFWYNLLEGTIKKTKHMLQTYIYGHVQVMNIIFPTEFCGSMLM